MEETNDCVRPPIGAMRRDRWKEEKFLWAYGLDLEGQRTSPGERSRKLLLCHPESQEPVIIKDCDGGWLYSRHAEHENSNYAQSLLQGHLQGKDLRDSRLA
jgi:hypothetical protein